MNDMSEYPRFQFVEAGANRVPVETVSVNLDHAPWQLTTGRDSIS